MLLIFSVHRFVSKLQHYNTLKPALTHIFRHVDVELVLVELRDLVVDVCNNNRHL